MDKEGTPQPDTPEGTRFKLGDVATTVGTVRAAHWHNVIYELCIHLCGFNAEKNFSIVSHVKYLFFNFI